MEFKETVQSDLSDVFFNTDEFAEFHNIGGRDLLIIPDSDMLEERKIKSAYGTYQGDILFHIRKAEFGTKPAIGQVLSYDGDKRYRVSSCEETDGIFTITLAGNRS